MECLFVPEMQENISNLLISSEEKKHLKALRIREGEEVLISNGKGLVVLTIVHYDSNWNPSFEILEYWKEYGEISVNFSIWVCNLHHKDRLETIVEKATELGATEIYLPICKHSQTDKIDLARLEKIAIASLKQSRRARKIKITPLEKSTDYYQIFSKFKNIILLDENGEPPLKEIIKGDSIILVGPEGGFHQSELEYFGKYPNLKKWYLGKRRLRTETAALKALSIITSMNE